MADPQRCVQEGVPEAEIVARAKGEIALAELHRVRAAGARFAAVRIRVADGGVWANNRHLPGSEAWLVGEWRSSGEWKYDLANLSPRIFMRALAAAIKARWVWEQAHQQLKGELGLGHFEGRSWTGLHRHALMCCVTFAFLQHVRLAGQSLTGPRKNELPQPGTTAAAELARGTSGRGCQAIYPPQATQLLPVLQISIPASRS